MNAELVQLREIAIGFGETRDDVDLLAAVVGAIAADPHAVGDEFDILADQRDVDAELRGLGAVHHDAPFDPGDIALILDIQ